MATFRIAAVAATAGLSVSLALAGSSGSAIGATRHPVVAPYLDLSEPGLYSQLYRAISTAGLHDVTAAFVLGDGCTPTWDDSRQVSQDSAARHLITRARAAGAHVIVSFGGQAGTELATSCASTPKLRAAYRSVIRRLHVHDVDFDIEGAALADHRSIVRRFTVLHSLQDRARRPLHISLTIPTLPSGLDGDGIALLKAARHARVRSA